MKSRLWLFMFCCLFLSACRNYNLDGVIEKYWYWFVALLLLIVIYRSTRTRPEKQTETVHKHHYFHFTDFQLSAQDFYDTLATIIEERAFPNISTQTVEFATGGILSPRRAYLEIKGDNQVFYVCAAPYGKNFFISYWLRDIPEGCDTAMMRKVLGIPQPKKTYYEADSDLMFFQGISTAISKAVTQATEARGLRKLQDHELIATVAD